jgi:hypothetical protein
MGTACFVETLVGFCYATRLYIPEESSLRIDRLEKIISKISAVEVWARSAAQWDMLECDALLSGRWSHSH